MGLVPNKLLKARTAQRQYFGKEKEFRHVTLVLFCHILAVGLRAS